MELPLFSSWDVRRDGKLAGRGEPLPQCITTGAEQAGGRGAELHSGKDLPPAQDSDQRDHIFMPPPQLSYSRRPNPPGWGPAKTKHSQGNKLTLPRSVTKLNIFYAIYETNQITVKYDL